jgi:hypothetical protein
MATQAAEDDLFGRLRAALSECAVSRLSGTLLVTGDPGGVIHLADGAIAAVQTPGAPSAEVILLRSRRVPEAAWDAAFTAAASNGRPMGAELVAVAAIGAGELEAVLKIALADAMFVLAGGLVERCEAQPGSVDYLLPLEPGAEADMLLSETTRRLRVLAERPGEVGRDRVIAVPGAARPRLPLGHGQDEILAVADGRRTTRDMAFALGRGVYAVMLQVARMRAAGLLVPVPLTAPAAAGETVPARPSAAADQPDAAAELPQRRRGMPAPPPRPADLPTGLPAAEGKPAPHRLLRPRSGRNAGGGDAR